jgi:hypothetical protein
VRATLFQCSRCNCQTSVTAGTVFQDTRKPLATWFRAMWFVTSQKNGASALGLQRVLGLGSYRTAWSWLLGQLCEEAKQPTQIRTRLEAIRRNHCVFAGAIHFRGLIFISTDLMSYVMLPEDQIAKSASQARADARRPTKKRAIVDRLRGN